jgi:nucleotide-binding universal stress UspA family protein
MKSFLVPLSDVEGGEHLLNAAFTLAEPFEAHVEVLHARADPADALHAAGMAYPGSWRQTALEVGERHAKELAEQARRLFENVCHARGVRILEGPPAPAGVSTSWHEEVGREATLVARRGRLTDLTVLLRPSEHQGPADVVEAALMDTGRPLLLVPPGRTPAARVTRVAVAWNGSLVAARAVTSARPFLERAQAIKVFAGEDDLDRRPTDRDLAEHLAWHGIEVETERFASGGNAAERLLKGAEEFGAELLVMGGYGHSRTRELMLGGVTRHVLRSSGLPVLIQH